ncbi:MAG: pitrilysin family protein [Bacteroidia bacterium]|nr:insulinase family protein [Bacteroidia bacterium]MDW8158312.1 pitrilysin family protein [Bacteroidia bacterium]
MNIQFTEHYLANGLKIIVHEDNAVPKVVVDVLYKVGAKDELPYRTGLAHLFEHLMFKNTLHIQEFDSHVQRAGGEFNAFTTEDITNYHISLPANQIETAFWLESDRMFALDLSEETIASEKSVVCEEFKQNYLNQPYGDADLLLRPLHFKVHPYQWKTIGKELSHIEEATLEEIRNFYYNFYVPENATLIVCGDVKTEEVLKLAEKWFGSIPARKVQRNPIPSEPKQTEPRSMIVYRKVPYAAVYKAYHAPGFKDPDFVYADMLTDVLSGGKSAILYQKMVKETQVAASINAYCQFLHDDGLIYINGRIAEGKTVEEYEKVLNQVLDELMQNPKSYDLQKYKNRKESEDIFGKTYLLTRAYTLALYDAIGHPELINTYLENYNSIQPSAFHQAMCEYLRPENSSTLYYLPE